MRVLLTGATGYIGRRLMNRLTKDEGVRLRLLVRSAKKLHALTAPSPEVIEGDTLDRGSLAKAASGIDVAYYLVHSMGAGSSFEKLDRISAENFREACVAEGVRRIIYLGGLGVKETASRHLMSRIETGEILSASPSRIQTIWLRAGIIIGSGGASFEIIRHLVEKLPVMITPKWVNTMTQPIAVDDVIEYLLQSKDLSAEGDLVIDVGAEKMTFRDMMERTSRIMGLKRLMIPVPVLTPTLSSYWLILFTPVPFSVASVLIEGLKSETVVTNDNARRFFPLITPIPFDDAVKRALQEIAERQVLTK
ncbi:MAG: NAD(P)H-binding protein [Chloroflexota bacterium]